MGKTGNTGGDIQHVYDGVKAASAATGVEDRVIFCIIMQESTGNVGVGTPSNMDHRPTGGLMQCQESVGFPGQHGLSKVSLFSAM